LASKNRYYKNSVPKTSGWNSEVMLWCKQEADRLSLKEEDRWGGLIFDEMTIQVIANCKCQTQFSEHMQLSQTI